MTANTPTHYHTNSLTFMTTDEIIREQARLLTSVHAAKAQLTYYMNLCIRIVEEVNTLSKETLNAEKAKSPKTGEERNDQFAKLNEIEANIEAAQQAVFAIQKLSEKANRKYNDAKTSYNRFCQRHDLKEVFK